MQKILILHLLFICSIILSQDSESIQQHYKIGFNNTVSSESQSSHIKIPAVGKFAESNLQHFSIQKVYGLSSESAGVHYNIQTKISQAGTTDISGNSTSELKIPQINIKNPDAFALIIGNEDYSSFQTDLNKEQNVVYANRDAELFKETCIKTLGLPEKNVIYLKNAGFVKIKQALNQINLIVKHSDGKAKIIFYYSGHGLPDEKTKEPYLIPVDVSGQDLQYAIPLKDVYQKLSEFPTKSVLVFLDACFTGAGRNDGLVSSRGIKIKPKSESIAGNLIVFNASSEAQPSLPYNEKQHGLFTWFLISKITESKGDLLLGDLDTYLQKNIPITSLLVNKVEQIPCIQVSSSIDTDWKKWKLKE